LSRAASGGNHWVKRMWKAKVHEFALFLQVRHVTNGTVIIPFRRGTFEILWTQCQIGEILCSSPELFCNETTDEIQTGGLWQVGLNLVHLLVIWLSNGLYSF
jgi:hypothetical protein